MDLQIIGIRDAGEPNERLLLKALNDCSLYGYLILDNTYDENGDISKVARHVFVFPNDRVRKNEYIRLWTKKGVSTISTSTFNKEPAVYHNYYRGYDAGLTVWDIKEDTPYLVHFDETNNPLF